MARLVIYELLPVMDDPRYEGFVCAGGEPVFTTDYLCEYDRQSGLWNSRRLAATWTPLEVVGRVRKSNDYPTVEGTPAFSARALAALRDLLEPCGELLPVRAKVGEYVVFNPMVIPDPPDLRQGGKPVIPLSKQRFEWLAGSLEGKAVFRIPVEPMKIHVTDAFVRRVREHGLKGFDFIRLWPLPPGARGVRLQWLERRRWLMKETPDAKTLTANTVVVGLGLGSASGAASKEERQAVDRLCDQLDALLVDPDASGPGVGMVEAVEYVDGEARILMSCADPGTLVGHLRPWLRALDWPGKVRVRKRFGEYRDRAAPEEEVEGI